MVQQAGQAAQSMLFHPWQSSLPDANISNVNATVVISTGGITDNAILAHSAYSLFTTNSSDQGVLLFPDTHHVAAKHVMNAPSASIVTYSLSQRMWHA